jgi:hypothetical protein
LGQIDSYRGGRLPFPDQRDPVARDQLGRERRIPFPVAKPEEHFESVAVGATCFVRGDTVQDSFDQLPDVVLPQISRLGHRDQGSRIHLETSFGLWAGRFPVSPKSKLEVLKRVGFAPSSAEGLGPLLI